MSKLIVEICKISSIESHKNADRLDILSIKGWSVIANKHDDGSSRYAVGDLVVYIPPDAILPVALATEMDVAKYCSPVKNRLTGEIDGYRVRAIRLRGVPSFGLLASNSGGYAEGVDVADKLGVTKWEPPEPPADGESERQHEFYHKYCEPENIRNYPDAIKDGTIVHLSEKVHGRSNSLGLVKNEDGWKLMASSHNFPRKEFSSDAEGVRSIYWTGVTDDSKKLLQDIVNGLIPSLIVPQRSVILFGEIFGAGLQDMHYGSEKVSFRAFDLAIDGQYIPWKIVENILKDYNILAVPAIYTGPFSMDVVKQYTDGPTLLCPPNEAGKFKGREGIVIKPYEAEYYHPHWKWRVIMKSVSVDYLSRKNATDGK